MFINSEEKAVSVTRMKKMAPVLLALAAALFLGCTGGAASAKFVCMNGSLADDLSGCVGAVAQPSNASTGCSLALGLSCMEPSLSKDGYLSLKVKNALPGEVKVTGVYCTQDAFKDVRALSPQEWTNLNKTIAQGAVVDLVPVPCRNAAGENQQFAQNDSFKGRLFIRHYFTITPEEQRIALGDIELNAG
jgi:hypothetical protein